MFLYFLAIAPAVLLAMWAQMKIKSSYAAASKISTRINGAAVAQRMLEHANVRDVEIEEIPGHLSDHYDPRKKVLQLSSEVYHNRSLAAVGIAAHEAGHAIQHARQYWPLVIRNAAVPAANFGSKISFALIIFGGIMHLWPLILLGITAFGCIVFFQLVNLPVEFDASARAKTELVNLGIVQDQEMPYIRKVLSAAALSYVAATLQSILTLLYYVMRFAGSRR